MKKIILGLTAIVLIITSCKKKEAQPVIEPTPAVIVFSVKSADIGSTFNAENFGNGFNGCTGANKSPQLSWENAPAGTKSFAITMIDLNAFGPGVSFDHWLMINIPSSINSLVKDAGNISNSNIPVGAIQTPNGGAAFDTTGNTSYYRNYAGVCPNVGNTNQYEITVYALNIPSLGLTGTESSTAVKTAINNAKITSTKMSVTATR